MSIESHFNEELSRVETRIKGDFTLDEVLETITRCVKDSRFRPGFAILSDHTAIGEPLVTSQAWQIVEHLEALTEYVTGSRWAVVTSNPASYGMMRMVAALSENVPMEMQVFWSHEEAEAWLSSPKANES